MSDTALTPGARHDGQVNVLLAHPVPDKDLARLGIEADEPHNVGDVITVSKDLASALIGAGMAQVDPEDNTAVAAYLTPGVAPAEGVQPAEGQTQPVEPAKADEPLTGKALDEALESAGLSKSGTVAEKQERLASYVPSPAVGADPNGS